VVGKLTHAKWKGIGELVCTKIFTAIRIRLSEYSLLIISDKNALKVDQFFIFKYIAEFDDIFGPMSRRGISPTFKTQFKKRTFKT